MPTERFYRLPKGKVNTIREAAIEEFKRVTPEEASINKIIQRAEISRGSFYTYFDDKYDLLKWVMGDFVENYRKFYIVELKQNGGDLWDVLDRVLVYAIQWVDEQGLVGIIGNMMRSNHFSEQFQCRGPKNEKLEEETRNYTELMYQYVDPKCCALGFAEFYELISMHVTSLVIALRMCFAEKVSLEKIQESYRRRMRLLRYGACPRPEQTEIN